jgi:hypothetical protein
MSEGRASASVRERPHTPATSGGSDEAGRGRKSRTHAEAQKRDASGTRGDAALRRGVESALDLIAGAHGLLAPGPVPLAEVEALLMLLQARLQSALDEVAR